MFARGNIVRILQRSLYKTSNADNFIKFPRHVREYIFRTTSAAANLPKDETEETTDSIADKLKHFKVTNETDNVGQEISNRYRNEYNSGRFNSTNRNNRFENEFDDSEENIHIHVQHSHDSQPVNKLGRHRHSRNNRYTNEYQRHSKLDHRDSEWDQQDSEWDHVDSGKNHNDSGWDFDNKYPRNRDFNNKGEFGRHRHSKTQGFDNQRNFSRYDGYGQSSALRNSGYTFTRQERQKPNYEDFKKDFYVEKESVQSRPEVEIDDFLDEHHITSQGNNVLRPVSTFEEAGFPDALYRRLQGESWEAPTPIQSVTWPQALSGNDMVGIAQTGSGKTLGFMMPAFVHVMNQQKLRRGDGPICLVLVPTRELCQQVQKVARDFGSASRIRSCAVYGGAGRGPQVAALSRGSEVVVATPGRLNDLLSAGDTNLDRCTYLVLDEADRMLDMGFEPQIRQIISQTRPDRQTLMWSATWPREVQDLARDYLNDAVQMNVGAADLTANKDIHQEIIVCQEYEKPQRFLKILNNIIDSPNNEKVLIFTQQKRKADELSRNIYRKGIHNVCIHGDKTQRERDRCLESFRGGRVSVMVATDVCARGLDVSDITYVVNYDFPVQSTEDYIHRIGRTGRAGNSGTAITLFTPENKNFVRDLVKILKQTDQHIPEDLEAMMKYNSHRYHKPSRYQSPQYGRYMSYGDKRSFRKRMNRGEGFAAGFTRMDN